MVKINDLYERSEYLINKLNALRFRKINIISEFLYKKCEYKSGEYLPEVDDSWVKFIEGMTWGGKKDTHAWFYKKITVPTNDQDGTYILRFKTQKDGWDASNPQFTLYINGKLKQGLDTNHTYTILDYSGEIDVLLYAYSGTSDDTYLTLECSLEYIYYPIKELYFDLKVPFDTLSWSDKNTKGYAELVQTINNALKIVDFREYYSKSFIDSCYKAREYVKENIYDKESLIKKPFISMIGHTHIDVMWLWTLEQTAEKAERSFSTVMELMKLYPEFKFMSSQPALYDILKTYSPKLYAQIKERILEGRWECEGSAYVENDCNLVSGESMIRQILHGKKFFKDEFGVDNNVMWLPDVFGYSACMPQILKKSGINYFLTSKISWNDTNQMPYDLFKWRGIDGTEITTYFLTTQNIDLTDTNRHTTYVGRGTPSQIAGTYRRFQQKELTDNLAQLVGHGDGGGGVTHDMIDTIRRLNRTNLNCPNAQMKRPSEFFALLENDIKGKKLPVWQGELYLEFHRGTYTAVSEVKKNNRKAEYALNNTEYFMSLYGLTQGKILEDKLYPSWQTLLLNQFHDVLPGSSIGKVYERSNRDFTEIFNTCNELTEIYQNNVEIDGETDGEYIVYNPNGVDICGNIVIEGKTYYVSNVQAKGYKVIETQNILGENNIFACENLIENEFFKIEFNNEYKIVSLYDKKAQRQLLKGTRSAGLHLFEDFAKDYDAWEIRKYYTEKEYFFDRAEFVAVVDDGARKGVKIKYYYQKSTVEQTIYLYEKQRLIDFDTKVDWHEINTILKFILPTDINTDKAICNIQFGDVERSTHSNTSWDDAKFEVCAQKYVALSDNGYSVCLINDCKYGYGLKDNDLSLTLLKCSTYPFDGADIGTQEFKYALSTDSVAFINSNIYNVACEYNNPLIVKKLESGKTAKKDYSLISADKENIVIETIKPSIDGKGYIIRLFDRANKLNDINLKFNFDFNKLYVCDMLENDLSELSVDKSVCIIKVKPYEIITLKVVI